MGNTSEGRMRDWIEALRREPEPAAPSPVVHWWGRTEPWQQWLRASPDGVGLLLRWRATEDLDGMLGPDAARDQLVPLLSRAARRDLAATGLGCTRRLDRSCRDAQICAQDPAGPLASEGPAPGGCDSYYGSWSGRFDVQIDFSSDDRHRAIIWRDPSDAVRLWVDGTAVGDEQSLDRSGQWVGDRFYVIRCEGPDDHPAQAYTMGTLVSTILTLLIHDAERQETTVLVPGPAEMWTDPVVRRDGDRLAVFGARHPDLAPDRTLPIS